MVVVVVVSGGCWLVACFVVVVGVVIAFCPVN